MKELDEMKMEERKEQEDMEKLEKLLRLEELVRGDVETDGAGIPGGSSGA